MKSRLCALVAFAFLCLPAFAQPVATPDSYSMVVNTTLTVGAPGFLSNDTSPLGRPLSFDATGFVSPRNGSVSISWSGSFFYAPDAGFSGTDSFSYRAFDGTDYSGLVTVTISVYGPTPQAITFTASPPTGAIVGGSYSVSATGGASGKPVVFSVDPAASAVCTVAGSTVSLTGGGTCIINANQVGDATYAAAPQVQQSFAVTRPLPVATPDNYATAFNTQLTVAAPGVLGNDGSALSLPLTAVIDSAPSHGSLTVNSNGSFTYTPNQGYSGPDAFTYKAFDGFASAPVSVSITVAAQPVPASIPTLSQWGLLILSSLIGLFALGGGPLNFWKSRRSQIRFG